MGGTDSVHYSYSTVPNKGGPNSRGGGWWNFLKFDKRGAPNKRGENKVSYLKLRDNFALQLTLSISNSQGTREFIRNRESSR